SGPSDPHCVSGRARRGGDLEDSTLEQRSLRRRRQLPPPSRPSTPALHTAPTTQLAQTQLRKPQRNHRPLHLGTGILMWSGRTPLSKCLTSLTTLKERTSHAHSSCKRPLFPSSLVSTAPIIGRVATVVRNPARWKLE